MHTPRRSALLAAALATLMLLPVPLDAQIGGFIRKRVENKIADRVLGESSERRAAPPTFDQNVLEITADRVDRLVRGLDAEVAALASARESEARARQQGQARKAAYEAEKKAYDQAAREYEAAAERYMKCQMGAVGRAMASQTRPTPEMERIAEKFNAVPEAEREALQKRLERRQEQMEAAQARGDAATAARLKDEMDADLRKTTGLSFAELQAASIGTNPGVRALEGDLARCGSQPVPPTEPQDPTEVNVSIRDSVRVAAFKASGLNESQYAILRERVAAWYVSKGVGKLPSRYGYADAELKVLDERLDAIKPREHALLGKDKDNQWTF